MPLGPGVRLHFFMGDSYGATPLLWLPWRSGRTGAALVEKWRLDLRHKRVADLRGLARLTRLRFGRPSFSQPA